MLNDCPTCKWCIGQANDEELVSGKKISHCKCSCPKAVHSLSDKISGATFHFMVANLSEVGKYGCEYTPKDCKESDCKQCATSCKNNQGLKYCFKCNTPTVKVSTGMFTVYNVCPKCKI